MPYDSFMVTPHPQCTTQVSRTPIKFPISKNNNNTSLPTSTHLQSPNTEIAHMRDNNIGLTTNNYQKIDHTLDNRVLHTTSQYHAVDRNTKILPSVSTNKKSQHKLTVVFIPPSKPRAYTVPSLLSQQNRILIPSDRFRSKINVSYQTKKKQTKS